MDCKKIKSVNPKGYQSGISIGTTEAEAPILWLPDDLLGKTLMLGKAECRRRGRQRMRWLDIITDSMDVSLEQAPGVGDGQGSLECCSPRDHKELDMTE